MEHSTLSQHEFKKGKFITPFNNIPVKIEFSNWFQDRLPEMLWLALIYDKYERNIGLNKIMRIAGFLKNNVHIDLPYFSFILDLPEEDQLKIYNYIKSETEPDILSPLTLIFSYSNYPIFAKSFYSKQDLNEKQNILLNCLKKYSFHQDDHTTDIRFIDVYYKLITDKLKLPKESMYEINLYYTIPHTDERMHKIRPFIRSSDINPLYKKNEKYLNYFWEISSNMTECKPFYIKFDEEKTNDEKKDFQKLIDEIISYYAQLYETMNPLDNKMQVLLGILTYSYKRFSEILEHNLYNTIVGRSIIRVLIEDYIMIKYLIKKENDNPNIWSEYQSYGIGQLKLIKARYKTKQEVLEKSHVDYKYLDIIVNDYMNEEFLNMDTKYFDKQGIREKAEYINEKDLFGLYYDYDSSFEHGLWGAIRECALLRCDAAGHQFHCIPDSTKLQNCKSIWHDSVNMMIKTINIIANVYNLTNELKMRLDNFDKQYSDK